MKASWTTVWWLALAACEPSTEVESWDPLVCGEGTELVGDVCENTIQGPGVAALLDLIQPECAPPQTASADFMGGCAKGICLDLPYRTLVDDHGEGVCRTFEYDQAYAACSWYNIVDASFNDDDADGFADDDASPYNIQVLDLGAITAEGAGPGREVGCMVDHAGLPFTAHLVRIGGVPVMDVGTWASPGMVVSAEGNSFGQTLNVTLLAR